MVDNAPKSHAFLIAPEPRIAGIIHPVSLDSHAPWQSRHGGRHLESSR